MLPRLERGHTSGGQNSDITTEGALVTPGEITLLYDLFGEARLWESGEEDYDSFRKVGEGMGRHHLGY